MTELLITPSSRALSEIKSEHLAVCNGFFLAQPVVLFIYKAIYQSFMKASIHAFIKN